MFKIRGAGGTTENRVRVKSESDELHSDFFLSRRRNALTLALTLSTSQIANIILMLGQGLAGFFCQRVDGIVEDFNKALFVIYHKEFRKSIPPP